jgi:hypothetical protein
MIYKELLIRTNKDLIINLGRELDKVKYNMFQESLISRYLYFTGERHRTVTRG